MQFCNAVHVVQDHGGEMARQWNLLRASERFRVIAIGVPVPPYRYGCMVYQYVVVVLLVDMVYVLCLVPVTCVSVCYCWCIMNNVAPTWQDKALVMWT